MKINSNQANFINNNFQKENTLKSNTNQTQKPIDCQKSLNPAEYLGRSRVNFRGREDFELDDFGKKFIENVSFELRFSDNRTKELKSEIADYLKEYNLKSLKEISSENYMNEQAELTDRISERLDLSDMESLTVSSCFCDVVYEPEAPAQNQKNKYLIDSEALEPICEKYDISQEKMYELLDVMSTEANGHKLDTVFDIFKKENNPKNSVTVSYIKNEMFTDNNKADDFIIDMGLSALKDDKTRRGEIDKHKYSDIFYNGMRDFMIGEKIAETFELPKSEKMQIVREIEKIHDDKDSEAIEKEKAKTAFFLCEKYNLPSNAHKQIISIINEYFDKEIKEMDKAFIGRF